MIVNRAQSIVGSLHEKESRIHLTNQVSHPYPQGVNKAAEYSWFYLLALSNAAGRTVTIEANNPKEANCYRADGLVFTSPDRQQWTPASIPVWTDQAGLRQQYTLSIPPGPLTYVSNTIFFSYDSLQAHRAAYAAAHANICTLTTIGHSLKGRPLQLLTFTPPRPLGTILVTTGCHPAEPDALAAHTILEYLATPAAAALRENYRVDIMTMQNPDGFALGSCLTANGINLYWNFRETDKQNCPEAYYLWQHLQRHSPVLYLDFHAYVHQRHRHPQPYLQPLTQYRGAAVKRIVRDLDKLLVQLSQGSYHYGHLTAWPDAVATKITRYCNTIAYTKYHLNLHEGIPRSQQRAHDIFRALTDYLVKHRITAKGVLLPPYGTVQPDHTDTLNWRRRYAVTHAYRTGMSQARSYARFYRDKYAFIPRR